MARNVRISVPLIIASILFTKLMLRTDVPYDWGLNDVVCVPNHAQRKFKNLDSLSYHVLTVLLVCLSFEAI